MVNESSFLENQTLSSDPIEGDTVLVRTEKGMAEIAKRSMRIDFRHRMVLIEVDDYSSASRYFSSFGGTGAAILEHLLDEGFIARREN